MQPDRGEYTLEQARQDLTAELAKTVERQNPPSYRPHITLPASFFPQWGYIEAILQSGSALTDDAGLKKLMQQALDYHNSNYIDLHAAAIVEEKQ